MNIVCVICKDPLNVLHSKGEVGTNASALHCGHVFHSSCLNQWFSTSASSARGTCPQCRTAVVKQKCIKLFWDVVPIEIDDDPTVCRALNECLKKDIQNLTDQIQIERDKNVQLAKVAQSLRENTLDLEAKLSAASLNEKMLAITRRKLATTSKELDNAEVELEKLRRKVESMRVCNTVLNGSLSYAEEQEALKGLEKEQICLLLLNYKKDSKTLEKRNATLKRDLIKGQLEMRDLKKNLEGVNAEMAILRNVLETYKRNNSILKINKAQADCSSVDGPPKDLQGTDAASLSSSLVLREDSSDMPSPNKIRKISSHSCTSALVKKPQPVRVGSYTNSAVASTSRIRTFGTAGTSVAAGSSISSSHSLPYKEAYDGLGGHSRLDDFPKPKITTDRRTVKKYKDAPAK